MIEERKLKGKGKEGKDTARKEEREKRKDLDDSHNSNGFIPSNPASADSGGKKKRDFQGKEKIEPEKPFRAYFISPSPFKFALKKKKGKRRERKEGGRSCSCCYSNSACTQEQFRERGKRGKGEVLTRGKGGAVLALRVPEGKKGKRVS